MLNIRPATPADAPLLAELIRDLAVYEKMADQCRVTESGLLAALFGPRPCAEAIIGEVNGKPEGFALFFTNFSTFVCKPGIYLEDLFVRPRARGVGLGKALLSRLAQLAIERGCGRLEWSVLDWNTPAIDFYKKFGATPMDEWTVFRVAGDALASLADAT